MPRDLRDRFDAGGSGLARYAARFSAVEINSSFYRSHRRETWVRWAADVPASFRFAVKLPQAITHERALRGTGRILDEFLDEVRGLGRKLGPLLVQLPRSVSFETRVAAAFFRALRARHDGAVVVEPRHPSWFTERADAALDRHRIGRVGADPACCELAAVPRVADRVAYWRWHGSPRMYWSPYGRERLAPLAATIRALPRTTRAWCIFDNTASQAAAHDALELERLLGAGELRAGK